MNSTAITTIDLNALTHNLQLIREIMPKQKILAMVKCNAYGHGLIHAAQAMKNADALGVATIAEAAQLRAAGIECDIIVMRGFTTADEIHFFINDPCVIACIHDPSQLLLIQNSPFLTDKKMRIWLKVDTGMHRLGVAEKAFHFIFNQLNQLSFIQKDFVVFSHLADADNIDFHFTQQQIEHFESITKNIPNQKSLLNSAGILAHAHAQYDWIRPGLMLYGVSPFQLDDPRNVLMKKFIPIMELTSKLIAIKNINKGEKVGYGCTFTAPRDMRIGIIGMGYGDSYPRQAENGTPVLIRGQRCSIVGRISMDMITVDLSGLSEVAVNDVATLWGKALSVVEIARCANTIPYELLCHLTGRVQRIYK